MPLAILLASSGNQVLNSISKIFKLAFASFFVSFAHYIGGGNLWIRLKLI